MANTSMNTLLRYSRESPSLHKITPPELTRKKPIVRPLPDIGDTSLIRTDLPARRLSFA